MDESSNWGYLWSLVVVLILVFLSALVNASEIAFISMRPSRIRQLAREGDRKAKKVEKLLQTPAEFLANVSIWITFLNILSSAVATALAIQFFEQVLKSQAKGTAAGIATGLMTFLVLTFGEIVPRTWAAQHAERIALLLATPVEIMFYLMFPLRKFFVFLGNLFVSPSKENKRGSVSFVTEEEIKILVSESAEQGVIEEEKEEMIQGVVELSEKVVREVMRPRIDMVCVEAESSLGEVAEVILEAGYSRVPVYKETVDNIIGIIYAKDLLRYLKEGKEDITLEEIIRPAYFVPETKRVDELLRELRQKKVHLAIVIDEYGGTAGLITVEDLIEEIVGEIEDEYDMEEKRIEIIDPETAIVDARMSIDEIEDLLSLEIPEGDYDTIGGLVFEHLGRIPQEGEKVELPDFELVVEKVKGQRIDKVRLRKKKSEEKNENRKPDNRSKKGA